MIKNLKTLTWCLTDRFVPFPLTWDVAATVALTFMNMEFHVDLCLQVE
jgi:hypothetical protein